MDLRDQVGPDFLLDDKVIVVRVLDGPGIERVLTYCAIKFHSV